MSDCLQYGKKYLLIKTDTGCKGVEGCIVEKYEGINGLSSNTHTIVKVIENSKDSNIDQIGTIWVINSDCEHQEIKQL